MCLDAVRCSQLFSDVLGCSRDAHGMFSGYFHDVLRIFSCYLKDTLVGLIGLVGLVGLMSLVGLVGLVGCRSCGSSGSGRSCESDW